MCANDQVWWSQPNDYQNQLLLEWNSYNTETSIDDKLSTHYVMISSLWNTPVSRPSPTSMPGNFFKWLIFLTGVVLLSIMTNTKYKWVYIHEVYRTIVSTIYIYMLNTNVCKWLLFLTVVFFVYENTKYMYNWVYKCVKYIIKYSHANNFIENSS